MPDAKQGKMLEPTLEEVLAQVSRHYGKDRTFHRLEVRVANPQEVLTRLYEKPGAEPEAGYFNP